MKTENTLENKSKFFAQYWGQEIQWDSTISILSFSRFDKISFPVREDDIVVLTPLSQITDEDAVEGYNISFPRSLVLDTKVAFKRKEFMDVINGFGIPDSKLHIYDFLRSKGYALPWMGLSVEDLIEYGWIKLKS